ncbi:hypothetical protein ACX1NX_02860 [Acinetobacter sp. ANC 5383]
MKYLIIFLVVLMVGAGTYMYKSNQESKKRLAETAQAYREQQAQVASEIKADQEKYAEEQQDQKEQDAKARLDAAKISEQNKKLDQEKTANQIKVAEDAVKQVLLDADSAKFRNQKGNCGEVNSKNKFGGYIGFSRYIYDPSTKTASIESESSSGTSPVVMNALWKAKCD